MGKKSVGGDQTPARVAPKTPKDKSCPTIPSLTCNPLNSASPPPKKDEKLQLLLKEVKDVRGETSILKQHLDSIKEERNTLLQELQSLKNEINSMLNNEKEYKDQIRLLDRKMKQLIANHEERYAEILSEKTDLQSEIGKLEVKLEIILKESYAAFAHWESLKQHLFSQISAEREHVKKLEAESVLQRQEFDELERSFGEMKDERDMVIYQMKMLREESGLVQEEYERNHDEFKIKVEEKQTEIESLRRQIAEKEAESVNDVNVLKEENALLINEMDSIFSRENKRMRKQFEKLCGVVEKLYRNDVRPKVERLSRENEALVGENEELVECGEKAAAKFEEFEAKIGGVVEGLGEWKKEVDALHSNMGSGKKNLEEAVDGLEEVVRESGGNNSYWELKRKRRSSVLI